MFRIVIQNSRGDTKIEPFNKSTISIGKSEENDIILPQQGISRKHALIIFEGNKFYVQDLDSTNGTFLNGIRITGKHPLNIGEQFRVGTFLISVQSSEPVSSRSDESQKVGLKSIFGKPTTSVQETVGQPEKKPVEFTYSELIKSIHKKLLEVMDLRRMSFDKIGAEALKEKTRTAIINILDEMRDQIPPQLSKQEIIKDVLNEALGLGPLEDLLADKTVSEIMVNHANQIYIERNGKIILSEKTFSSNEAVLQVIERIVAPLGRRIDESSPLVDARLRDGSRVNAIIPPLALKGPCITIRKFSSKPLGVEDLIRWGSITPEMAEFFKVAVQARKNIIISGGTGSGKTTLLNIISGFIPHDERIITVEDAAELQLPQEHVVSLEARPPNIEGKGAIPIRTLVKNCLRMRPDRIVVGECRGGEALDMLQAMNTGHDGSLTTLHANSPRDALLRLETLVLMSGMELPVSAIRQQIASAVDLIIQQTRFSCGTRKVSHVAEVVGMEGDIITMQDIFIFKQYGYDEKGKVVGEIVPTGMIPKFYDEMRERKIPVNTDIFTVKKSRGPVTSGGVKK